jgi:hypothetical protein
VKAKSKKLKPKSLLAVGLSALVVLSAAAQQALPRTPDGHPDLQGIWLNDSVTTLERPKRFADKAFFSESEALAYEHDKEGRWRDRFGDLEITTTGELSDEWQEDGTVVPGRRTSLIVDPADGRIPALTPLGQARADARADALRDHPADGPEDRTLYERCLTGSAGPPMLPAVYDQGVQIVQTRDRVLIVTEMIHDTRIVRINGQHLPPAFRLWLGDSIGHWEGDTLVVDTTNFTDKTHFRQSGDGLHVIERFTHTAPDAIRYDFTIDDTASYTRPWSGTYWIRRTTALMYEYACHEANHSMVGILRGARAAERESQK